MAGWFAKLMHKGHARSRSATAGAGFSTHADVGRNPDTRDARYDAIVRTLREREAEDRVAREKRQRGYRQSLESDSGSATGASSPSSPDRLHRFPTKVPCRVTPEARALLGELRKQFSGGTITFAQVTSRRQAVMLAGAAGAEPRQIGWMEHSVEADPKRCNARSQGLVVESDGGMLLLRFRYPSTTVRLSSRHDAAMATRAHGARGIEGRVSPPLTGDGLELPCGAIDEVARVDFAELRPALDLRQSDKGASPRLVWVTRPEIETMDALRSRDYEAFYMRFKLEVLAGIWSSLTGLLANAPVTRWHRGSHYTVVREPDATKGKILQRTVDDSGRAVDIGVDRIYDATHATDILLLYLEGDILADFADIYFTLQSLDSTDAWFLKEEFFTGIRRFWAGAQSLASRYGSDLAAVVRMSQRAVPMPAQVLQLRQDWTNLRQSLVDRYGEGGRNAAQLAAQDVRPRTGPAGWPFASFPAGEVNVGLRLVYRQEWRHLGAQRGEVVRTIPAASRQVQLEAAGIIPRTSTTVGAEGRESVETTVEQGDATVSLDDIVAGAARATVEAMKWPLDVDGSINTGIRCLASRTDMGLEAECRESSRDTSTRLGDIMRRMATRPRDEAAVAPRAGRGEGAEPSSSADENISDPGAATYVYSRLQHRYEVLTRPAEIQNVVLVAEKLPTPAEIDLSWVRRHDWILTRALLDESFRDALESIGQEAGTTGSSVNAAELRGALDGTIEWVDAPSRDPELDTKRERLYEHIRANILHYQRVIWQQEDPQQRSMRYRKSGRRMPLEWRFELESGGALTIDELGDRLGAANVDGQFAAYSGGREARLDQLIDPAGPIGYYGNYAIYQMRPEFGSADLFSMLHFFKSPYLHPNPETGEPEVEDPLQIEIADDPAVIGASDEAIEQRRVEMLEYVPELRLELAGARRTTSDGTNRGAADASDRQARALKRHFATYLFRRERARRIVLDTDGLVVDAIRRADPARTTLARSDGGILLGAAPEGYRLILESGRGIELLSARRGIELRDASDRHGAAAEWAILRGGGQRMPSLLAGAAAPDADERMIVARDGRSSRLTAVTTGAAHTDGQVILAAGDEARTPVLRVGRAHDPVPQPVIAAHGEGARISFLLAGQAPLGEAERLIAARDDRGLRLTCGRAGAAHAPEQAITAGGDQQRTKSLPAGPEAPPVEERLLLPRNGGGLRLISSGSAGAGSTPSRPILAVGEGERTPTLRAGQAHEPPAERGFVAGDDGRLRLTSGAGAEAAPAHKRVILMRDEEWLRPSLVAG